MMSKISILKPTELMKFPREARIEIMRLQRLCRNRDETIKQLCRYIGKSVSTVRKPTNINGVKHYRFIYPCEHCPIPKYRGKNRHHKCKAAQGERACSTELINYFTKEAQDGN